MALSYESTHEYYMKDPTMFYCESHNCLRITRDFEDSVMITGVTNNTLKEFVDGLFKNYPELAASFEKTSEVGKKTTSSKKSSSKTESIN